MRKTVFLLGVCFLSLLFFNSCSQCNRDNATEPASADSTGIPEVDKWSQAIKTDSLNPYLYYKRAQAYEAYSDFKSAATDMYLALTLDSLRPEFYLYTAELFKKSGEPQRGIALMNKAIVTDSLNSNFYVKAAELAFVDTTIPGNYKLALDYLNAAITKDMQNADIYFFKGNIFKEMGDTAKAVSSFQTATELNPKYYDAYVQIGLLLKARNDKSAQKYFDNAIKVSDKPEDALYAKANLLKEEGLTLYEADKLKPSYEKLNAAISVFKQVVEVNHRNVEAYMGIGFCYYQMDSLEQAYEYYDKALKLAPAYAGAYFSKGLCAEELGKLNEAAMLYQNCLNIDPTFERAKKHLEGLKKQM
ncbi:MAG: tetratricopeptide repeat protein [Chitinophagales bacterium]|nr:tetratricopeptide repeat protein [Chitinophagales bacterium]